jgi:5-formyltetrahydrofolate cyclo-ligase
MGGSGAPAGGDATSSGPARGDAGSSGEAVGADATLLEQKRALRQAALAERAVLLPDEVESLSAAIQERLLAVEEYARARTVHAYVGAKANEVRTDRILARTLASGRRLVVPRVAGERLAHHEVRSLSDLAPARFGLLEPDPASPEVDPGEIDLVVVPGLAFDRSGNRLGFGKGYYDRFLSGIRAVKAAVLYGRQIVEQVPVSERDVPVDLLVTEDGVEHVGGGRLRWG